MGALTVWFFAMNSKLSTIGQKIEDQTGTKIVESLNAPQSQEHLVASLTQVTANVRAAQAQGGTPSQAKALQLGKALDGVIQREPGLPEAWQAATTLVSYRASSPPNLGNCLTRPWTVIPLSTGKVDGPIKIGYLFQFHDCTLDLSDSEAFLRSEAYKGFQAAEAREPGTYIQFFDMERVHLVYSGGSLFLSDSAVFRNCTFELRVGGSPPPPIREITRKLLVARDYRKIEIGTTIPPTSG